jgi:hypothetical protein
MHQEKVNSMLFIDVINLESQEWPAKVSSKKRGYPIIMYTYPK